MLAVALATTAAITGCGAVTKGSVTQSLFLAGCDRVNDLSRSAFDVVALDWTGGVSPIYPNRRLAGIDLSAFETTDGATLADRQEEFKARVRDQVSRIFCEWPDANVAVKNAEDRDLPADTIVHLTQEIAPNGSTDIGEGEYDPCNLQNDNSAIIFGERVRQLGGEYTFDQWVFVFANVTAHEVAHTLGYSHVPRPDTPDEGRGLFVELMFAGHSMTEMRREQRFVEDQTNCPSDVAAKTTQAAGSVVNCSTSE